MKYNWVLMRSLFSTRDPETQTLQTKEKRLLQNSFQGHEEIFLNSKIKWFPRVCKIALSERERKKSIIIIIILVISIPVAVIMLY